MPLPYDDGAFMGGNPSGVKGMTGRLRLGIHDGGSAGLLRRGRFRRWML